MIIKEGGHDYHSTIVSMDKIAGLPKKKVLEVKKPPQSRLSEMTEQTNLEVAKKFSRL